MNRSEPGGAEDHPVRCEACGTPIEQTEWHPVATRFDEEDEFHLYVFCSARCRQEWEDE